ncbi:MULTISPECIES: DUF3883 domain-containing protein [Clostridium]|uniref:DUF3883 domain-containing protein n=1 Tax=Clostridium aquiflavi TaxID=3073603 RepID=A0ABU1ECB9_9CLOT|nr:MULTISPECIES: DUF3883 domain-containing protein [Clostridium]MDR5586024.1 DUF3883 domain-containing protein [Clostridium sp. 5N-1]
MIQENIDNFINSNLSDEKNKEFKKLEKLRQEFINKFKLDTILSLEIDKYIVGKKGLINGGDDTFCYWLETKLMNLGKIKGGSTADKKFGVYYGKTKNEDEKKYRTINKWGNNYQEAFGNIKLSIYHLLMDGKNEDFIKIHENKLSPMFKGKILSTYFPEKYISIFSEEHIDYFLQHLPIYFEYEKAKTIEMKKQLLLEFKQNDEKMKLWNNYIYMVFLYTYYSPKKKDNSGDKGKYQLNPKVDYIDFNYIGRLENDKSVKGKNKKPDYEKEMKRKKYIGNLGENIVFNEQIKSLRKIGREDLAEKVTVVSTEDDRLGYDILSFDKHGNEIYIEVKSTISTANNINFIITDNEYRQAMEKENYMIYLIYEVETNNPKIHILNKNMLKKDYMQPIAYRVRIKTK